MSKAPTALHQQQDLRQQQRLLPMQVQFVRMLEMTGPEIEAEVCRQLDDMPALEVAEAPHPDHEADEENGFNESAEDVQLADYSGDDIPSYMLNSRNYSADDERHEHVAVNDELSLMESLQQQLGELDIDPQTRMIAEYITGNLDNNGYLKRTPSQIADDITIATGHEVTVEQVNEAWRAVRALDPAGVGAIDLRDCLLLQLDRRKSTPDVSIAREIISHYFDLFSKKHYDRLAELLSIDHPTLEQALGVIGRLNPKPGNQQGDTAFERSGRMIVPEFQVEPQGDKLVVTLLNNIPELTIAAEFAEGANIPSTTPRQKADALTFLRTRREEAQSFIQTLSMRQQTLFNVMTAIATIQRDFFMTGDETRLHPMILKDVASLTGYDLSVISRATASKYVMTVAGVYPLKFFFNERPNADNDTTVHQIAAAIREIISGEDKRHPLTDEEITAILTQRGFTPARRTVAKYRERLGYPVARLRRELIKPTSE